MRTISVPAERPDVRRASGARPRASLVVAHGLQRRAVLVIAVIAVLLRLPFVASDPSHDEAGYLLVGQQWHAGGSSLYGNYWVDRPPLLIGIFQLAADMGGLVALRLVGCLATALVVLGTAHIADRLGGRRAAPWAALSAAALCVTPLLGGLTVDGELLSAPFVVAGVIAVLTALSAATGARAVAAAALVGTSAVTALLVKQNMADVAVFGLATLLVAWRRGEVSTSRLLRLSLGTVVGALACLGAVAVWTVAHGTSLAGVFDAMYPFRIEAGRVMAASNRAAPDARLWALVGCWVVSGGAVIMLVATRALLSRRFRSTAVWGLIATVLFDIVSIALGGSYWHHYLIQLVVPVAVLSGLLVAHNQPAARLGLHVAALTATAALVVDLAAVHAPPGTAVGQAIANVSSPRDSIVTVWGHADVTRASGLSSPYPYLWSLPARTLDPHMTQLDAVLSGPRAPTWYVAWTSMRAWSRHGGAAEATARELTARYRAVAQVDGHTVYLHRGVHRLAPRSSSRPPGARERTGPGTIFGFRF